MSNTGLSARGQGPTQKTQVVEFGQRFDLLLEGPRVAVRARVA